MKQLICEMCGSNDLVKHDGLFRCTYCGMQYTPDEAKKLINPPKEPIQASSQSTKPKVRINE